MNIYLIYDSVSLGGAQLLLANAAVYLNANGKEIGFIGQRDSFVCNYLDSKNVPYHFVDDKNDLSSAISSEDIILAPLSELKKIADMKFEKNPRVILWDMHPYNIIEMHAFSFFYKKRIFVKFFRLLEYTHYYSVKNIVENLISKKSLYFMCKKNSKFNSDFYSLGEASQYLPIFSGVSQSFQNDYLDRPKNLDEVINLLWVSRLDSDKVEMLNVFIGDLEKASNLLSADVILHVVGVGDSIQKIDRSKKFQLVLKGRMFGDELQSFVSSDIDIAVGVGTSILDLALLGLPAIVMPGFDSLYCYKNVSNKYMLIQNLKEFDVSVEEYHLETAVSLEMILSEIQDDYLKCASASFEHVLNLHTPEILGSRLLVAISLARSRVSDLAEAGRNTFVQNMFLNLKSIFKRIVSYAK